MRTATRRARGLVGASQRAKNGAAKSTLRARAVELANESGEDHAGSSASRRASGSWERRRALPRPCRHEDVFEVVGLAHGHRQRGEEPGHLGLDDAGKDGVLPAGKVDTAWPSRYRFSRDVVRGRLLQAWAPMQRSAASTIRTRWELRRRRRDGPPWRRGLVGALRRAPSIRRREAATDATLWHDLSQCHDRGIQRTGPARSPPAARRARGGQLGGSARSSDPGRDVESAMRRGSRPPRPHRRPGRARGAPVGTRTRRSPEDLGALDGEGRLEQLGSVARMRWRTRGDHGLVGEPDPRSKTSSSEAASRTSS